MLTIQDFIPVTKEKSAFLDIIRKIEDSDDAIAIEELSEKYKTTAALTLSEKQIGALIDKIKILEKIENMNEIVALAVSQR